MSPTRSLFTLLVPSLVLAATVVGYAGAPAGANSSPASADRVARGKYLVTIGSCNDCHTPLAMTPRGPEPDMSRALSGHPADLKITAQPALPAGPWMALGASTMTAWAGPWGVSFTANLTPDRETGLGNWTEAQFIAALRTGRRQGKGRPILPPMPWSQINKMTDDDLRAVFAYLQSLPPLRNRVPEPIDPVESGTR